MTVSSISKQSRSWASRISVCLRIRKFHCAFKHLKNTDFLSELKCLTEGKSLTLDSNLFPFNVFLDTNDIIRIEGRLTEHLLTQKHPMLLPKASNVVTKES